MSNAYDFDEREDPPRQPAQSGPSYDGQTASNPQTGQRVIWRVSPGGRGRWVELNSGTAFPAARERMEDLQNRLNVGERTVGYAREFMDVNRDNRSGGIQNDPNLPEFIRPRGAQRMANISQQIVGANWIPGTSQMQNTNIEQANVQRRYVSPTNQGKVNDQVFGDMRVNLEIQRAAVADMQQWLRRNPTLDGWDAQWRPKEARIREAGVRGLPRGLTPQRATAPVRINSDAEFDRLPSGARFVGPDGVVRRKP